jgi:membrane protein implicated in regulation of membrane protease activity
MNWPAFFLGCFVVGFALSALSLALSPLRLHVHVHLPFVHHPVVPHLHAGSAGDGGIGPVNFATVMAFLAWFGGTGFLLTSQLRWLVLPALVLATLAGGVGAFAVFWVMAHVLWSPDENMQSADYQMVGVLGRIGHSIRDGGTGELIYSHAGTRHSCGARSADGLAIPRGEEVVVTAYDRGIAYVRRWDDLAADQSQGGGV